MNFSLQQPFQQSQPSSFFFQQQPSQQPSQQLQSLSFSLQQPQQQQSFQQSQTFQQPFQLSQPSQQQQQQQQHDVSFESLYSNLPAAFQNEIDSVYKLKANFSHSLEEIKKAEAPAELVKFQTNVLQKTKTSIIQIENSQMKLKILSDNLKKECKHQLQDTRRFGLSGLQQIQSKYNEDSISQWQREELPIELYTTTLQSLESRLQSYSYDFQQLESQLTYLLRLQGGNGGTGGGGGGYHPNNNKENHQDNIISDIYSHTDNRPYDPVELIRLIQTQHSAFLRIASEITRTHEYMDFLRAQFLLAFYPTIDPSSTGSGSTGSGSTGSGSTGSGSTGSGHNNNNPFLAADKREQQQYNNRSNYNSNIYSGQSTGSIGPYGAFTITGNTSATGTTPGTTLGLNQWGTGNTNALSFGSTGNTGGFGATSLAAGFGNSTTSGFGGTSTSTFPNSITSSSIPSSTSIGFGSFGSSAAPASAQPSTPLSGFGNVAAPTVTFGPTTAFGSSSSTGLNQPTGSSSFGAGNSSFGAGGVSFGSTSTPSLTSSFGLPATGAPSASESAFGTMHTSNTRAGDLLTSSGSGAKAGTSNKKKSSGRSGRH